MKLKKCGPSDHSQNALVSWSSGPYSLCLIWTLVECAGNQKKATNEIKTPGTLSLVIRDMPLSSTSSHPAIEILWDPSNGKIRIPDQYHWIRLFKTILTPPSRQIYIKYTKRYESKTQKIASTFNLRFLSQFSMDLKIVRSTRIRRRSRTG